MSNPAPEYVVRPLLGKKPCPHGQLYYCSKCPGMEPSKLKDKGEQA